MGRGPKIKFPPTIYTRRGKSFVRLHQGGRKREVTLGEAGSPEALRAYQRLLNELEVSGGQVHETAPRRTVCEVLDAFLRYAEKRYDAKQFSHLKLAAGPAVLLYGDTPATDFGPLAFQATRLEYSKRKGRTGGGVCRFYVNKLGRSLQAAFRWAAAQQLVPQAVADAVGAVPGLRRKEPGVRPDRERVRPAPERAVEATLPELPPIVADMVRLQRLTGMRPGEACVLRPRDIERKWLAVATDAGPVLVWCYKLDQHKTDWKGHLRWIPLGPEAQRTLRPYLERDPDAYCFSPREASTRWLREHGRKVHFRRRRGPGERYTTQSYDRAVTKAARRAGVPHWSPNQIRHAVSTAIEADLGREDARCVLGHTTPSTTAIYSESAERAARVLAVRG